jgi:hypothetical protein
VCQVVCEVVRWIACWTVKIDAAGVGVSRMMLEEAVGKSHFHQSLGSNRLISKEEAVGEGL